LRQSRAGQVCDGSMSGLLGSLSGDDWTVIEESLDRARMRFFESILSLGNGFVGSRAILEEGYEEGYAGTYLAGVYDKSGGQSFAIVNAPNPLVTEMYVDGRKLTADGMEIVEHRRVLDMKRAVLYRRTLFSDGESRYEYESARFFSLYNMHMGLVQVSFRCLDSDISVVLRTVIDGATKNEMHAVGGPRKHYQVTQSKRAAGDVSYLEARTNDLGITVGMASASELRGAEAAGGLQLSFTSENETSTIEHSFVAEKGVAYSFDRYVSVFTSRETEGDVEAACLAELDRARSEGASKMLARHQEAWEERWRLADVSIEGDPDLQRALRFSLYHLLRAAAPEDLDVSIAPKALSGEWYQGHIFWDTEIFMLPFFVYTDPQLAKNLLLYRARRLGPARERAAALNYEGALWPWESADSGREETPPTWINFDGTVLPVYNAMREHHIAADIVYGIYFYHLHTGDDEFMLRHGLPMVFETARFWASRVSYDEASGLYEIKLVIGPNEFQEGVDNNSYTNAMTRWTLRYACQLYQDFKERNPLEMSRIAEDIGLTDEEVGNWKRIAERILFLVRSDGLIEEFEGYLSRRNVTITDRDDHGMPLWPTEVILDDVKQTQLIKQADVVLLLYLLSDQFSLDVKRVNFEYYEPRTTHVSSLSITSYAILANELGDTEKAYAYLHHAANSDLEEIHGNTDLGVHAAELGGTWQIVIRGLAGVRLREGVLRVDPSLPDHWRSLRFHMWLRGNLIQIAVSQHSIEASMVDGSEAVEMDLSGARRVLQPGGAVRVER
jgi:kojibiose phosphorylase